MSWAGTEPWDLYLGVTSSGLADRQHGPIWKSHVDPLLAVQVRLTELRNHVSGIWKPCVRVWMSGALLRPFIVEPLAGSSGEREAMAVATARAAEATGLAESASVWLDSTYASKPRMAVAYSDNLVAALIDAATSRKLKLLTVRPWWALALDEALQHKPNLVVFAAEDVDSTTVLVSQADRWLVAETSCPPPLGSRLQAIIARRAFLADSPLSETWHARLDPESRPNVLGWPVSKRILAGVAA